MTATIYERDSSGHRFTHPRAWCVIHLDALRHNARVLATRAGVPLVAMVKADAYGLGAVAVAKALGAPFADEGVHGFHDRRAYDESGASGTPGASDTVGASLWALGVATVPEAIALRDAGCEARILCCSPLLNEELPAALQARMIPSLHRAEDIVSWSSRSDAPWHLAIDTGMNRAGVRWSDTASLAHIVAQHKPQGVYTHFHSAQLGNASRELQTQRFANAIAALPLPQDTLLHAANSYAIAATPSAQTEPQSAPATQHDNGATSAEPGSAGGRRQRWHLARPGVSLYGVQAHTGLDLKPVLHVYARVVDIRDVQVGESVSYDATWTAHRQSRIATVAVGYGDGYRRSLSNVGEMIVGEARVRVVGNVTMDLTMIDVTDVPCEVGDIVTVLGGSIDEVAQQANLSPYELLVGWRLRLPRVYRESV